MDAAAHARDPIDRGTAAAGRTALWPADCDRFLEFWNLVFIQFFRTRKATTTPWRRKASHTGMGLERIAAIMQGKESIFEIDNMREIASFVEGLASKENPVSVRVITDHMRAATFLASDGVIPSNEGRGYVMRRLIRRSIRHGKLLGIEGLFLGKLAEKIIHVMATGYSELLTRQDKIVSVLVQEEERFAATLATGLERLEELMAAARTKRSQERTL